MPSHALTGRVPAQASADRRGGRRRIGEVLVEAGVLTPAQLGELLAAQASIRGPRQRIGRMAVAAGLATERQVAEALAKGMQLGLVDLTRTPLDPEAARLLPRAVAERFGVLVLSAVPNGPVRLAVIDPTDVVALDEVRMHLRTRELEVGVAVEDELRSALARVWSLADGDTAALLDDFASAEEEETDLGSASSADDAPIVRMVDMMIADAVTSGASDLHVEVQRDAVRVRLRVDGVLRDVATAPRGAAGAIISRLKILASLDIAERRRPQDGRARLQVRSRTIDVRVSTLPALHGEKVVLRLLPYGADLPALDTVGLDPAQLANVRAAFRQPQGLVLITGPTGAGKTSTLYAALREVATPDKNIVTLEDPVEVTLPGITQVHVNERSGTGFASGLRAILRQDPDVVLVGEIRDAETAEHALTAAMTGHLVLSTLHTTSAVNTVTRLVDMGVPPYLLSAALSLVVAQRLVRRPCSSCAVRKEPSEEMRLALGISAAEAAAGTPVVGMGCTACGGTGYRGRIGVYEVLPVTPEVRAALRGGLDERALPAAARAAGLHSLRASALAMAARGETTYEEVLRVTDADGTLDTARCTACDGALSGDMVCCPWCATPADTGHCASCTRPLEPGWRVCPWCRTPAAS